MILYGHHWPLEVATGCNFATLARSELHLKWIAGPHGRQGDAGLGWCLASGSKIMSVSSVFCCSSLIVHNSKTECQTKVTIGVTAALKGTGAAIVATSNNHICTLAGPGPPSWICFPETPRIASQFHWIRPQGKNTSHLSEKPG